MLMTMGTLGSVIGVVETSKALSVPRNRPVESSPLVFKFVWPPGHPAFREPDPGQNASLRSSDLAAVHNSATSFTLPISRHIISHRKSRTCISAGLDIIVSILSTLPPHRQ